MKNAYDLIVVGLGGIGSATCYWAARSGLRVLGLERFELGHAHGASQDHSRIIRLAQHRHTYGRLAAPAYTAWAEVEEDSGEQLVTRTGGLVVESPRERIDHGVATGTVDQYAAVMGELGYAHEVLRADELTARWSDLRLDGDERGLYDPATGIVDAARANAVHARLATARGGELRPKLPVTAIRTDGSGVAVHTAEGEFRAERAVVASGP